MNIIKLLLIALPIIILYPNASFSQIRTVTIDTIWENNRKKIEYVDHEILHSDTSHVHFDGRFPQNIIRIEREQGDSCNVIENFEYDKKGRRTKWNVYYSFKNNIGKDELVVSFYKKGELILTEYYERNSQSNRKSKKGRGHNFVLVKTKEFN